MILFQVFYSYKMNLVRYDLINNEGTPVKIVHDFNSGVGYRVSKITNTCTIYPLDSSDEETNELNSISLNSGNIIELKNPNDFLNLVYDTYYAGKVNKNNFKEIFINFNQNSS